jgi:hypothetical protein
MAAVDARDQIGPGDEWYLHFPSDEPLQPYRSARTVWPLSAEELSRTERQAQSGNASALNNLGNDETPTDCPAHPTLFACGVTGAMHLFGWGQRPVNRYKAYDCFCRAYSAGCAAATHNRAACKWLGYGCKLNEEEALAQLKAVVAADSKASTACLMALVSAACLLCLRVHNRLKSVLFSDHSECVAGRRVGAVQAILVSRATHAVGCNLSARHQCGSSTDFTAAASAERRV